MSGISGVLRRYARDRGVRLDVVEKDYALSYLLAAIADTSGLADHIVLKGGTALKKLYYADYRFSEDLDFSTHPHGHLEGLSDKMASAVQRMADLLQEQGAFGVSYEPLRLKHPHPSGQEAFIVRVRFPWQRRPLCRLKVEITVDEPVLLSPQAKTLIHNFGERLDRRILGYALPEIVAEKLRALLQSQQRLRARGWGASRVCRDYYDLWEIFRREKIEKHTLSRILEPKCRLRGVSFQSSEDFLTSELREAARKSWGQWLLPFVPNAPAPEEVLDALGDWLPGLVD